jgi:CDP-diacylglycerol pyrophosphatase
VKACELAKLTVGTPLPCLAVDLKSPGYAVLRAPDRSTHVITVPLRPIAGLEDPDLQRDEAAEYWRAAWEARRYVVAATKDKASLDQVGLAINSARTRSQDQLHIHAGCIRDDVIRSLLSQTKQVSERKWLRSQHQVGRGYPFLKILAADVFRDQNANLFRLLADVPGGRRGTTGMSALLIQIPDGTGRYMFAAQRPARASVENYFDDGCEASVGP